MPSIADKTAQINKDKIKILIGCRKLNVCEIFFSFIILVKNIIIARISNTDLKDKGSKDKIFPLPHKMISPAIISQPRISFLIKKYAVRTATIAAIAVFTQEAVHRGVEGLKK
ncbi:MAG: hypothetical protein COU29_00085 [Candidatus Magasanikbacteria bacterium CG10_big_fil_rev_8_21_14_0_10_36_32]|uniref:Uncharacterized protein n=1 Tax=Candidatus Magasanikbacteria bacterium CG10_big_fil_rev_8_21_14_0_10_36_32 TaxID=1974646 RepID=A0A2M6W7M9_9BACT|nr:MAG: hypothetical protein COU29_00085 [Candidatus Magasanikbacteria bacterium CG10_big_fil_rev_8_21_14_0_10_36_32]